MPRRLEDAMREYFDAEQDDRHLADSHRGILREVRRAPRLGMADVAVRLGMSASACAFLIEELIGLGYLTEAADGGPCPGGLMLTDAGRSLFASVRTRTLFQ